MNIAIPVQKGMSSGAFHLSEAIDVYRVDLNTKSAEFVENIRSLNFTAPTEISKVLRDRQVKAMVLGGIACKIKAFFEKEGIKVFSRIPGWETYRIARLFAEDKLPTSLL